VLLGALCLGPPSPVDSFSIGEIASYSLFNQMCSHMLATGSFLRAQRNYAGGVSVSPVLPPPPLLSTVSCLPRYHHIALSIVELLSRGGILCEEVFQMYDIIACYMNISVCLQTSAWRTGSLEDKSCVRVALGPSCGRALASNSLYKRI
jgi:hypothetical protein